MKRVGRLAFSYVALLNFLGLVFLSLCMGDQEPASRREIVIASSDLTLTLASDGHYLAVAAIAELLPDGSARTLGDGAERELFAVSLRGPDGPVAVDSRAPWRKVDFRRDGDTLHVRMSDPEALGTEETVEVTLSLTASAKKPGIEMAWSGRAKSDDWSLDSGKFPIFVFSPFGSKMKACYPELSGVVRDDPYQSDFRWHGAYPNGWTASMAWCALWDDESRHGLYFAAHDPDANLKYFDWWGKDGAKSVLTVTTPFENMGERGNAFASSGTIVLRSFDGDWYDAARIYKQWIFSAAPWRPEMTADGRKDLADWMKNNSVFLMMSTDPRWLTPNRRVYTPLEDMDKVLREFSDAVGLPGAVHWYLWHQNSYDNDYPHFFPAKEGFEEEVAEVQEDARFRVMPYTNGHLWDTRDRGLEDWRFSSEGAQGAVLKEDGSMVTETYDLPTSGHESDGSLCVHAAMCPAAEVWQKMVRYNTLMAMNQCGTTGVYIDQVGATAPYLCFARSHGHPVGGGHWWLTEGYWKIFAEIRRDMRRPVDDIPFSPHVAEMVEKNPQILQDRIITTECNAEVYAHLIDGFLTWHWQSPDQVPAFPVIYGGTTPMFGRCSTGDSLALQTRVCQALTWGEQIGWFDAAVRDSDAFPFVRDAIRCRHAVRRYFYTGEMLRAPRFEEPLPTITADWLWGGKPNTHTEPAVQASVWRIVDFEKKLAGEEKTVSAILLFSNASDDQITRRVSFSWEELGLCESDVTLRRVDADGAGGELPVSTLSEPICFPPKHSFALELIRR